MHVLDSIFGGTPPSTNLQYFYLSRNNGQYKPCKGWDGGVYDAMQYAKYGYDIKIMPA